MIVISYGGGTNSTAMLIGLHERGIKPDLILFADTGGEKPHTYDNVKVVNEWCKRIWFPEIVTVAAHGKTLEQDCLDRHALPSIAYGFKSCSQRFKMQPQDKYLNNWPPAKEVWSAGHKVTKLIGYDADEHHRTQKDYSDDKYDFWYPLVEWDWGRDECIKAINRAGLPQPGKSACFFCPSSKPHEVRYLKVAYPELAQRAIEMEKNADLTSIKGLGRNWAWADLLATDDMFSDDEYYSGIDIACGCYDG
jgi:hypothetical protein